MGRLRLGLAQVGSLLGNVPLNLRKHLELVGKARRERVNVLAFPELSLTGYMLKDLAYELSEDCARAVEELSRSSEGMCILVGLVEEPRAGMYRNSVATICDGEVLGYTPKLYLPNYGIFEESRYYAEGGVEDVRVYRFGGLCFGSVICEDAWHPEPVEYLARLGADLVFIHASSPIRGVYGRGATLPEKIWESINITRAVENTIFVAFVNRVGSEDEEFFWGGSMVVSPEGRIISRGRKMEEDLLVVEIDRHLLRRARRFSSFKEHRRELHEALSRLP